MVAFIVERIPEAFVRFRVVWLLADCRTILRDGPIKVAFIVSCIAEVVETPRLGSLTAFREKMALAIKKTRRQSYTAGFQKLSGS